MGCHRRGLSPFPWHRAEGKFSRSLQDLYIRGIRRILSYSLRRDLIGCGSDTTYESAKAFIQDNYSADGIQITDQFADILSAEKKAALVSFCLCLMAVDETIDRNEVAFVLKLIEA